MTRTLYLTGFALAAVAAGCLDLPADDDAPPMCHENSDCDTASGEVCADGVCWGDPPSGVFSALIGPPQGRNDLVATEIRNVQIDSDGWFLTPLILEEPVLITGTVTLACPSGLEDCQVHPPVAASVTVHRAARIPGGPPFVATAHTTEASAEFSIPIPRGDVMEPYFVTIAPARSNDVRSPNDRIAPAHMVLYPTEAPPPLDIQIGAQARKVTGHVNDAFGLNLRDARVAVRGRWDQTGAMAEISSVGYTDALGNFEVYLPSGTIAAAAEVVVTPPTIPMTIQPTLIRLFTVPGTGPIALNPALNVPYLGEPQMVAIPIEGTPSTGGVAPIAGATVTLVAEVEIQALPSPPMTARLEVSETTDGDGKIYVYLVPSSPELVYHVYIKPPPASDAAQYATVLGSIVDITPTTTVVASIQVPNQVSIRGELYSRLYNAPAGGVVVTATPNPLFLAVLSETLQRELSEVVSTSATTNARGDFKVFVDPEIGGLSVDYDLRFEPGGIDSLLPSWQHPSLTVDLETGYDLQHLDLPYAAYVRSVVVDMDEVGVMDADVRLFEEPPTIGPCYDNPACTPRAVLRAQATSGDHGAIHLVLSDE